MLKIKYFSLILGERREHDCKDAGGRVMQEQLPRSGNFN